MMSRYQTFSLSPTLLFFPFWKSCKRQQRGNFHVVLFRFAYSPCLSFDSLRIDVDDALLRSIRLSLFPHIIIVDNTVGDDDNQNYSNRPESRKQMLLSRIISFPNFKLRQ